MTSRRGLFMALVLGLLVAGTVPLGAEGLKMPEFSSEVLDNGLTLQVMRHATVPLVSMEVWIRAGATEDPPGKEGLASLTAESLRRGAGTMDGEAFAEALGFLGADFSTGAGRESARISLDLLSRDLDQGLELLTAALLKPMFLDEEVEKLRDQMAESVIQAKDNPRNVLGDYHSAFLFGDHPYARPVNGTEASLPALSADDVRGFYRDHYGADRTVISVVGDLDVNKTMSRLRKAFLGFPTAAKTPVQVPAPAPLEGTRVLLVNKTDTPQTWFRIGNLGPARNAEDYVAAEVVRTIFGGRFTSWLNAKLRIETGLTYGASYWFSPGFQPGAAGIFSFTAKETTKEAVDLALAQLDRLHEEGIPPEDLESAKAYMKGQGPYDYETATDLAVAITQLTFYGLDRSRVDDLFARIDAVDEAACKAVIERYFRRDHLVFTTIGVADEVRDVLQSYGPLEIRENATPGFN